MQNRNLLARLPVVGIIQAHDSKDALVGFYDSLAQSVHAGKILTVGIVLFAFVFESDWKHIRGHSISMLQDGRQHAQAQKI